MIITKAACPQTILLPRGNIAESDRKPQCRRYP